VTLAPIDLLHMGMERIIGVYVLETDDGPALFDCGPSSTIAALEAGLAERDLSLQDMRHLLLSHIHFDHAGAAGSLVREHPGLQVHVSEIGAPHLVDPEKLVASATRLWGADMDRLWGEVRRVPREALVVLNGGETIDAGGRRLAVAYTPGHASHHVSYFDAESGVAFVGDTAGIRRGRDGFVLPPTPPPDIDLEAWRTSLQTIAGWRAETLFVTHFGPHAPAGAHLTEMADHLDLVAGLVRTSLGHDGDDASREAWYADQIRRELRRRMPEAAAQAYEVAGRFDLNWKGLARYWRKRGVG